MKKLGFSKSALVAALLFVTAAIASSAQTFTTLVNFDGTNGASPQGFALAEKDGDLYGATEGGGQYGQGLLFKLTPTGTFTPLYNFCPESGCADGSGPGGLLLATNGEFYGSSFGGGAFGYGTIFEFTGEGAPTTIHSFDDTDGTGFIYLMQGSGGFIYGMASYGGNLAECFAPGCGTVFRIALNGEQFTLLHTFCVLTGCPDGAIPYDALAQGTDGDYYGTTWGGGGRSDGGSVFRMTPRGKLSTIYRFCTDYPACSDGRATTTEAAALYNAAAARLMAEFRKTSLALREYRTPVLQKQITVVKQQNLAAGDQQIAYLDGQAARPSGRAAKNHDTKLGNNRQEAITHEPQTVFIPQPKTGRGRAAEPIPARSVDATRPQAIAAGGPCEPTVAAIHGPYNGGGESPIGSEWPFWTEE